jgi:hypothetical protein
MRKKTRLRKAPAGSRQLVDVRPGEVVKAIQEWEKLGYDLHERSQVDEIPHSPYGRMKEQRVILTFVKR